MGSICYQRIERLSGSICQTPHKRLMSTNSFWRLRSEFFTGRVRWVNSIEASGSRSCSRTQNCGLLIRGVLQSGCRAEQRQYGSERGLLRRLRTSPFSLTTQPSNARELLLFGGSLHSLLFDCCGVLGGTALLKILEIINDDPHSHDVAGLPLRFASMMQRSESSGTNVRQKVEEPFASIKRRCPGTIRPASDKLCRARCRK